MHKTMSEINTYIKVSVPKYPLNSPPERFVIEKRCTYCNCRGYFLDDSKSIEPIRSDCPLCKGSGKLKAEVEITWKPSK